MKTLLTPLLLIISTLFFVANASAENPSGYTQKLNSVVLESLYESRINDSVIWVVEWGNFLRK